MVEQTNRWDRLKDLFDAALERDPGERPHYVAQVCGRDLSLRDEIESLLAAYERSSGLSCPALGQPPDNGARPQASIGPYQLVRKLGEGGMGQVWLAEQSEPIRRQVALKLIRSGVFDDALLRRFQAERQSLALMDHPGIAKVFDAGATDAGQPYLVMEYVPGEPIVAYCDRKKLTVPERLALLIRVCEGVQHAHQKAIIHGDLKPANILVAEIDGQPAPRIIDFGLARPTVPFAPGESIFAAVWGLAGTPGYISPEQAAGGDIDTRADVYALGVILYELLTGTLPFDATRGSQPPLDEILRQLREQDPPRPSARLSSDKALSQGSAPLRSSEPEALCRLLRGDLDAITMKALEKDRARRYGAPSELAADLERHRRHQPVLARPASAAYRTRRYVRRHRFAVGAAATVAVMLATFSVLEAIQFRRITRERDRANRITGFMTNMFQVSDPSLARGNQVTAREILDNASAQISGGLSQDPELESQLLMVMGLTYENLGLYPRAESLYAKAAALRSQRFGPENDLTLDSQTSLGWIRYRLGRFRDSETLLRRVLNTRTRLFGAASPGTMAAKGYLGVVLMEEGNAREAESLERQVLDGRRRQLGDSNPETLTAMNHLTLALMAEGKWAEAESLGRDQLERLRRTQGNDAPQAMMAAENLGIILYRRGRLGEAEALDRQNLAAKRRVLGPEHPETIRTMNTLMAVLTSEGKLDEAQSLEENVVAARSRVLGPDHPLTLSAMGNLANILMLRGNLAGAERLQTTVHAAEVRVLGDRSPTTALSTYNLAGLKLREGKPDEALRLLRESIDHGLARWVIQGMPTDTDLKPLQGDPRFTALLSYAAGRTSAAAK